MQLIEIGLLEGVQCSIFAGTKVAYNSAKNLFEACFQSGNPSIATIQKKWIITYVDLIVDIVEKWTKNATIQVGEIVLSKIQHQLTLYVCKQILIEAGRTEMIVLQEKWNCSSLLQLLELLFLPPP